VTVARTTRARAKAIIFGLVAGRVLEQTSGTTEPKLGTALWRLFADLPPQDFDCGGSAPHHHSFGVEAALVQDGAPAFEFAKDVGFAVRGAGSGVVKLMHVGHAAE
jgi:hypothetical protein